MINVRLVLLAIPLLAIPLLLSQQTLFAKANDKGPDSTVVIGVITEIVDGGIKVEQQIEGHIRHLKFQEKMRVTFLGFKGIGMTGIKAPKVGYGVMARVIPSPDGDTVRMIWYSPVLPPKDRKLEKRHEKSADELFAFTDENGDKAIDYHEYSVAIHRSTKHGPEYWPKMDKDKSDTLDREEFEKGLVKIQWWRLSRKTADQWMQEADTDRDGQLSEKEFMAVSQSNHNHDFLKRVDKDKNEKLSLAELQRFLDSKILPRKPKTPKKKKAPNKKKA